MKARSTRREAIPLAELRVKDTHRLIPTRYSESGTVLSRLSDDASTLPLLVELDDATNDRFLGEEGLLPGIGIHELIYGVRYAHIVNAAYTHASPSGGRFNSSIRGAWYAGIERATSLAEVAFHKLRQLEEVDWPDEEPGQYDDYLADFTCAMHDLQSDEGPGTPSRFRAYLKPEPIPDCYARPQQLAASLMAEQSNGILYPSVRRPGGTCIVCFRPPLVYNVRRGARLELRLQAHRAFKSSQVREIPQAPAA